MASLCFKGILAKACIGGQLGMSILGPPTAAVPAPVFSMKTSLQGTAYIWQFVRKLTGSHSWHECVPQMVVPCIVKQYWHVTALQAEHLSLGKNHKSKSGASQMGIPGRMPSNRSSSAGMQDMFSQQPPGRCVSWSEFRASDLHVVTRTYDADSQIEFLLGLRCQRFHALHDLCTNM